jgi:hypothetical protein
MKEKTESENLLTKINSNIFFKEFTFDKNEFKHQGGESELADNILWLDDLLFLIQIKERNIQESEPELDGNGWFNSKVLKKAKDQIKKSVQYFSTFNELKVKNVRNHLIYVSKANLKIANKVIIYTANGSDISETNQLIKFCESKQVGNIHILNIENYHTICEFLITPTELDDYLKFRERFYLTHKEFTSKCSEQYLLAHFLNTENEKLIDWKYINTLSNFEQNLKDFDMFGILNKFSENISIEDQKKSNDYYEILKEIVKLKRGELKEFKERFQIIIEMVNNNETTMPYRFTSTRTGCGFVFIPLPSDKIKYWENALINFTERYKYKNKLNKCIGIIISKDGEYYDLNWALAKEDWIYNKELEIEVKKDSEVYGESIIKIQERYKFKN